jgi:hypothetical protein
MADTSVQVEIANWIRNEWLPYKYGQRFVRESVSLSSGGSYKFDAISIDGKIAVAISTSGAKTASGKNAIGKKHKIHSDMYFLLLASVERRIVVLTEPDMLSLFRDEDAKGRVSDLIELEPAPIPKEFMDRLQESRRTASLEVTPRSDTD